MDQNTWIKIFGLILYFNNMDLCNWIMYSMNIMTEIRMMDKTEYWGLKILITDLCNSILKHCNSELSSVTYEAFDPWYLRQDKVIAYQKILPENTEGGGGNYLSLPEIPAYFYTAWYIPPISTPPFRSSALVVC